MGKKIHTQILHRSTVQALKKNGKKKLHVPYACVEIHVPKGNPREHANATRTRRALAMTDKKGGFPTMTNRRGE